MSSKCYINKMIGKLQSQESEILEMAESELKKI